MDVFVVVHCCRRHQSKQKRISDVSGFLPLGQQQEKSRTWGRSSVDVGLPDSGQGQGAEKIWWS